MILGYARVSKGEAQDTRMQETALRAAGVERLFAEQASGQGNRIILKVLPSL